MSLNIPHRARHAQGRGDALNATPVRITCYDRDGVGGKKKTK